ncbi:hypothetical protein [Pseudalkalibacillus hwajinpoensis]|uniref:hypothetical protein n=1 Tax=Guptibacillus hwajinpoensis TaxID=208199 RepID=UPI001CFD6C67|nr:hypothetical protein [Pseudalkalibacillus hwajinpoensis]
MIDFTSIIHSVEQWGAELLLEGNNILIKNGKSLPEPIIANIREYKQEILSIIIRDNLAKREGLIVGVPGELYTITLSHNTSIYIEHLDNGWEAWRETYYPLHHNAVSSKIIAIGSTFDFVILKVKQYIDFYMKKRGG